MVMDLLRLQVVVVELNHPFLYDRDHLHREESVLRHPVVEGIIMEVYLLLLRLRMVMTDMRLGLRRYKARHHLQLLLIDIRHHRQ